MKKRVVRLSISTLLLLISIIVVAMSNNEEDIRDESCAIETNQYVGALLEYQNTGDTYRCVISKREVDFFNALALKNTGELCTATDDWIFRVTATTKMLYGEDGEIDIDNVIPTDAETLIICVYDDAIIVGEKKYLLEGSIIGILKNKFITDELAQ